VRKWGNLGLILAVIFGSLAVLGHADDANPEAIATVVRGDHSRSYTIEDLERLDTVTAQGTFTRSSGTEYTATYTGVPVSALIGNVAAEATVRVTATDGYSMNYQAGMLLDPSEGIWILAYKENGAPFDEDTGPFRIVQVGEETPHFTSALSAKMVATIEVLGTYEPYTLTVVGVVTRVFTREELEAGNGCPCHTATVSVTSKGETHAYTGLPLWRLVAYVDDEAFPPADKGIHYEDEDFSDASAANAYEIALVAADGYAQTVSSSLVARDDRFLVAFKRDGAFLDPESDGFMRFVYDDAVELPEGGGLRSVKFLTEILLNL